MRTFICSSIDKPSTSLSGIQSSNYQDEFRFVLSNIGQLFFKLIKKKLKGAMILAWRTADIQTKVNIQTPPCLVLTGLLFVTINNKRLFIN